MLSDLYARIRPSQLSCLSSSVSNGRGFESHLRQPIKNDCFGRVVLCCFAFLLCCCCCLAFLSISWSDCPHVYMVFMCAFVGCCLHIFGSLLRANGCVWLSETWTVKLLDYNIQQNFIPNINLVCIRPCISCTQIKVM